MGFLFGICKEFKNLRNFYFTFFLNPKQNVSCDVLIIEWSSLARTPGGRRLTSHIEVSFLMQNVLGIFVNMFHFRFTKIFGFLNMNISLKKIL